MVKPPQDAPRWLDYMRLGALAPAERNAKRHDQGALGRSMDAHGFLEGLVLDERTGRLLGGHGRMEQLQARKAAGGAPPDGLMVTDDGDWLVPVQRGVHSRDDLHAEAMGLVLNRLVERGGWDPQLLTQQLQELEAKQGGLDATGFTRADLDDMLAAYGPPPDLGDLQDRLGQPQPEDFWPVLRIKVSPALKARWDAATAGVDGTDADRLEHLVHAAELAQAAPVDA